MKLTKIELQNWITFRHIEINLIETGLFLITGDNGAGKSSILEAVRFALGSNQKSRGKKWSDYIFPGESIAIVKLTFQNSKNQMIIERIIDSEKNSGGKYRFNGITSSITYIRKQLDKYKISDPDNIFVFVDANQATRLKSLKPLSLLNYFEDGIKINQQRVIGGKTIIERITLSDIKKQIINKENDLFERSKKSSDIKRQKEYYMTEQSKLQLQLQMYQKREELLEKKKKLELELKYIDYDELIKRSNLLEEEQNKYNAELRENNEYASSLAMNRAKLENQRDNINQLIAKLEAENKELDKKIEEISGSYKSKEGSIDVLKKDSNEINTKIAEKRKKMEELSRKIDKNIIFIREKNRGKKELTNNLKDLEKQIQDLKKNKIKHEDTIKELVSLEEEVKNLKRKLKITEEDISEYSNKKRRYEQQLADIRRDAKDLQDQIDLLAISSFSGENIKERETELNIKIEEIDNEIRQLKDDKIRAQVELEELERRYENLEGVTIIREIMDDYKQYGIKYMSDLIEQWINNGDLNENIIDILHPNILNAIVIDDNHIESIINRVEDTQISIIVTNDINDILSTLKSINIEETSNLMISIYQIRTYQHHLAFKFRDFTIQKINDIVVVGNTSGLSERDKIEEEIEEKQIKINRLNIRLGTKESELSSLKEEKYLLKKYSDLENDLVRKQRELDDILSYFSKYSDKLENLENERKVLKVDITKKEKRLEQLKTKLPERLTNIDGSINKINMLISSKTNSISTIEKEIKELETENIHYDTRKNELQTDINNLIEEKKKKDAEIKELESTIKSQTDETKKLKIKRNNNKSKIKDKRKEKENITMDIVNLETEQNTLNKTNNELIDKISKLDNDIKNINAKINELSVIFGNYTITTLRKRDEISNDILQIQREINTRYAGISDNVNLDYEMVSTKLRELNDVLGKLEKDEKIIKNKINELRGIYEQELVNMLNKIGVTINDIFKENDYPIHVELRYSNDNNKGINIDVNIRGKIKQVGALSSGQQTLLMIGILVSLHRISPTTFVFYDELITHLDDDNSILTTKLILEETKNSTVIYFIPTNASLLTYLVNDAEQLRVLAVLGGRDHEGSRVEEIPMYRKDRK